MLIVGERPGSLLYLRLHTIARRFSTFQSLLQLDREWFRGRYRERLPSLDPHLQAVCRALRRNGVVQLPLSDLPVPYEATLRAVDPLQAWLRDQPNDGTEDYYLIPDELLLDNAEPYLFGLSPLLLDLAEAYCGLPVDYLGVNVKREIANGKDVRTRRFHLDPEDYNVLKIIIYLNDVDPLGGPFECLDVETTSKVISTTDYFLRGSDSNLIRRMVPESRWRTCTGPRLTVNIADTARCLHRAKPPIASDRYSMTFSYLSRRAYVAFADGKALQRKFVERFGHLLSERQLSCVSETPRFRWAFP